MGAQGAQGNQGNQGLLGSQGNQGFQGPTSENVSVFSFTHTSGSASTGALGFTPKMAIYTAVTSYSDGTRIYGSHSTGIANGTGTGARVTGTTIAGGASGYIEYGECEYDGSGIAFGVTAIAAGAGSVTLAAPDRFLDVTAWGSSNITLTWDNSVTGHDGYLIVMG